MKQSENKKGYQASYRTLNSFMRFRKRLMDNPWLSDEIKAELAVLLKPAEKALDIEVLKRTEPYLKRLLDEQRGNIVEILDEDSGAG